MSATNANRKNPNGIYKLSTEDYSLLKKTLKERADSFIQVGPKRYIEDYFYDTYKDEIYNFEVRKDDVWVITLPRSGTTLTQELVWQVCNNLDFETGLKIPLVERFPFFEYPIYNDLATVNKLLEDNSNNPKKLESIYKIFTREWEKSHDNQQRFYKSHWAFSMLPPELLTSGCKVVYVARNPKDQMVSRFKFYKMLGKPVPDTFEEFWTLLEKNLLPCLPYFDHILEAWEKRNEENILFLFYEDIVINPKGSIIKVAEFFGKQFTEEQINKLASHIHIDNFKKNKSVNDLYWDYFPPQTKDAFIRKGKVNVWKEELFTEELNQRANKWIQEQYKRTDLRFPNLL